MSAHIPASQSFVPVITGGDLGAYTLAREFHEAYGVISAVVPTAPNLIVGGSKITQLFPAGQMFDPDHVVQHLGQVANSLQRDARRPMVLVAGYDHLVRIVATHRQELLDMGYVFFDITPEQLDQAALKENFYAICAQLGIKYPKTAMFDCSQDHAAVDEFMTSFNDEWSYPLVLKAGDGSAWANTSFEGRRKVHFIQKAADLSTLLKRIITAGYRGHMIVQEFIPGPDSNLRILTQFRDSHGGTTLSGTAEVLVEDHAPGLEGNSRAVVVAEDPGIEAQGQQLMDATGWHGFGMFDIKIHETTGKPYFLEMNPRLGRHHYYLTLAGANPATYIYHELIKEQPLDKRSVAGPAASLTIPYKLAIRYANADQRLQLAAARTAKSLGNPLIYAADRRIKRNLYQRYRLTKAAAEVAHTPGTMHP